MPEDLDADAMMRPASSRDTKFFWDGVNAHELRIQKRAGRQRCSIRRCPRCGRTKQAPIDYVVASGKGTVFSFVVHHAPKVPGRTLPFVIALVELEEGVRMLGELRNVDPATVEIGMPVRATYIDFPANDVGSGVDALRLGARRMSAPTVEVGTKLPELVSTETRRSSSRPRWRRATFRMCTTTGTRRRRRDRRTSSSTSSPTPVWCSAISPTGRPDGVGELDRIAAGCAVVCV